MQTITAVSTSPEQTASLGASLGSALESGDVVLLTGDLGAGKTQFTKGIAHALGIEQPVTSPTFNLVCEYVSTQGVTLRHFDLYRLEDETELDDIDYFGLLEDAAISVVEWGDKFPDALPLDYLLVAFTLADEQVNDDTRILRFTAQGTRGEHLLAHLGGQGDGSSVHFFERGQGDGSSVHFFHQVDKGGGQGDGSSVHFFGSETYHVR